ncbi:MAG: CdaR family protein [Thermoanaerobaculales bacterium]|jgi:YbbR domain-containing protein|nr:CdaR family protein [Thermoanaerobaculales bacterium]
MLRPRHPLHFIIALVTAVLLWYGLAGQQNQNISVRGVKASLTLVNMPRELVLTSSVPDTISLQLRGPLNKSLDATAGREVYLDLSDARPGTSSYTIDASGIPLPTDVEVVSIEPAAITLELERLVNGNVLLEPVVEGVPAPGFVIGEVKISPIQVNIQGPESRVNALERVETTPVSIEGATGPTETAVTPKLADPLLRSLTVVPIVVMVDVVPVDATPTPTPEETTQ